MSQHTSRTTNRPSAAIIAGALPCDVLLIQPPIRDFYLTAKRTIPYGLVSIAAGLRKYGFRVAVLDGLANGKSRPAPLPAPLGYLSGVYGPADVSPFALFHQYRHFGYALATIAEWVGHSGASLVGISSLFSAYEDMALECARLVKTSRPQARVVLGGHHPTAFPDRILSDPAVDFVLRGDGEAALPALACALRDKKSLIAVPGIAFDGKNRVRHINPPVYVENLNCLPLPALDLVNTRYYARKHKTALVIAASRGCPMQCSYCCMGANARIPYRRRSVSHVMREITRAAKSHDIGLIDFEDENLALDRTWFIDLLQELIRYFGAHRPELRAMNGLFPPALDAQTIALMREAGFRELNLSLGSCDRHQVRRFNRPDVAGAFDRALDWAEAADLTAVGYLIAGAPGQDPLTSVADLLFLASRRVLAGLSIYYPAPDSPDFARCREADLLPASPLCWRSTALPIDHATRREESLTLLRLARMLNFMKRCLDDTGRLPAPSPIPSDASHLLANRTEIGRHLLRGFLYDGIMRGVRPDGKMIAHSAAKHHVDAFRKGIQGLSIRGVGHRSGANTASRFPRRCV